MSVIAGPIQEGVCSLFTCLPLWRRWRRGARPIAVPVECPFSGESGVLPIPKRHKCHDRQQYILAHWRVIAGLPQ